MADALLSAAAERLVALVEEQARYHVNLVRGAEEEVHSLAKEFNTIRNVLDDAENRRFQNKNINSWLSRLEQTSYEMEDVLDEWDYAILKLRMGERQAAVARTLEKKVNAPALTDHDTISNIPEAVAATHTFEIKIIPGVEFNTIFYLRKDSGEDDPVSILAYYNNCAPIKSAALEKFLGDIWNGLFLRVKNIVSKLNVPKIAEKGPPSPNDSYSSLFA